MDPVDRRDELTIAMPLAVFLTFPSPIAVLSLIRGFGLGLALVCAKHSLDGLLAGGMSCSEVEPLSCRTQFAVSELVDECFIGRARGERSYHVYIHDVGKLIALLGKAPDVLM